MTGFDSYQNKAHLSELQREVITAMMELDEKTLKYVLKKFKEERKGNA